MNRSDRQTVLVTQRLHGYVMPGATAWVNSHNLADMVIHLETYDVGVYVILKMDHRAAQILHHAGVIRYDYEVEKAIAERDAEWERKL